MVTVVATVIAAADPPGQDIDVLPSSTMIRWLRETGGWLAAQSLDDICNRPFRPLEHAIAETMVPSQVRARRRSPGPKKTGSKVLYEAEDHGPC